MSHGEQAQAQAQAQVPTKEDILQERQRLENEVRALAQSFHAKLGAAASQNEMTRVYAYEAHRRMEEVLHRINDTAAAVVGLTEAVGRAEARGDLKLVAGGE